MAYKEEYLIKKINIIILNKTINKYILEYKKRYKI